MALGNIQIGANRTLRGLFPERLTISTLLSRITSPSPGTPSGVPARRFLPLSLKSVLPVPKVRLLKKAARSNADCFFEHEFSRLSQAPTKPTHYKESDS
jgi:hypothetical protein